MATKCECGCDKPLQIGRRWFETKANRKGEHLAGYAWSGYVGEGWPLHWIKKRKGIRCVPIT